MNILMFGWEFPPHNSGGLGVACEGLAEALSQIDVNLTFVLPTSEEIYKEKVNFVSAYQDSKDLNKLIKVNSILSPYLNSTNYLNLRNRLKLKNNIYASNLVEEVLRYASFAYEISQKNPHDVIHAHDWLSFPAAMEAKRYSNKPFIAHVHATEIDRTGGNLNEEIFEIEKRGVEAADRVIAVSNLTKNILVNKYQINENKIDVVHNGSKFDNYSDLKISKGFSKLKKAGYKLVLFLGRITFQKGPDYFVLAAKKVLEHKKNVIFVVVGSGDMEGQMMEMVSNFGISDNFIFAGFLRGDERIDAFVSADLLVMPSVSEPFGIVPLEALNLKTPVLISKQSGVSEVLNHALKADFWDIDDIADKIISVVLHASLRKDLKENGYSEAKNQTWNKAALKIKNIYQNI